MGDYWDRGTLVRRTPLIPVERGRTCWDIFVKLIRKEMKNVQVGTLCTQNSSGQQNTRFTSENRTIKILFSALKT